MDTKIARRGAGDSAGWSRAAFAAELGRARAALPMGGSVIDELRLGARY